MDQLARNGRKPFLMQLKRQNHHAFSYADLSRTVKRLAWGLVGRGVQPGDVVGLFASLDFPWIASCLGILRAGGVVMPLDLQLERETLAGILKDSDPQCVFADADHLDRLREAGHNRFPIYLTDDVEQDEKSWKDLLREDEQPLPEVSAEHHAALFYTSGTTGPPKGVPLSHGNIAFQIDTVRQTGMVVSDDRVLLPLPPHHVYPFVIGILVPLSLGLTIVLPHSLTGPQMVRALHEGEITLLFGVPRLYDALFAGIASRFESNVFTRHLFYKGLQAKIAIRQKIGSSFGDRLLFLLRRRFAPRLRIMASGGAPLAPELALQLEALGWKVAIGYGLTETAPLLTLKLPGDPCRNGVGLPVKGVRIRLDPESLPKSAVVETPFTQGEILAKGPNVFSGYHNLPNETDAAFTQDGWFRTGDIGHFDAAGCLHVTGRVSTLIVTKGGENIQPDIVEAHLSVHPLIREAGVLQLENGVLAAVVVPEIQELRVTDSENVYRRVQQAIAERAKELPSYQRVNDVAVTRTPLPRTRLGKIRRHRLADIFHQAKTERASSAQAMGGPIAISDMTPEDRRLLENRAARTIWTWLGERYADVPLSPDTSPELDLGVDSIEWLNITLEIRQRAGIELGEGAIGRISTIRDLLEAVAEKSTSGKMISLKSPFEDPEKTLTGEQKRWLEPRSDAERRLAQTAFAFVRLVVARVFPIRCRGVEHLPASGPYIIAPNHVSYLDPFAIAAVLGFERLRQVYWAGFAGIVIRNPFFRFFSRLSRTVPIDPTKGMISSLAFGAAVLNRKQGLVWFPEGERSRTGELLPFKTGVGILLEHFPVPVVPAFIRGTETILPRGRAVPRSGAISVVFGRPLHAEDLARQGTGNNANERIASGLREAVARLGYNQMTDDGTGEREKERRSTKANIE